MLLYKMYQNKNPKSSGNGMWYARAVVGETVDIEKLSKEISGRCTVTDSDILAVLRALVTSMTDHLTSGHKVVLDKLGSFRATITTKPAETAKDFTAANIIGAHINFRPYVTIDANRKRTVPMLSGLKVRSMDEYDDPSNNEAEGGGEG